jgi:rhamnogalacturonyl hydrolase YesR
MRKLCLRGDGLYRHSPLDEAAWGRGNGFPALGLALCLSEMAEDHPSRGGLLREFRAHLAALQKHQDVGGCWRQVIDKRASYREFTCTCMIGFAMVRGVRRGWLSREEYQEPIRRAWTAVKLRVGPEGRLVDVCTGTGKQPTLRHYYDRPAILGRDDRGGAMGLLFAVELMEETGGIVQ